MLRSLAPYHLRGVISKAIERVAKTRKFELASATQYTEASSYTFRHEGNENAGIIMLDKDNLTDLMVSALRSGREFEDEVGRFLFGQEKTYDWDLFKDEASLAADYCVKQFDLVKGYRLSFQPETYVKICPLGADRVEMKGIEVSLLPALKNELARHLRLRRIAILSSQIESTFENGGLSKKHEQEGL